MVVMVSASKEKGVRTQGQEVADGCEELHLVFTLTRSFGEGRK